MIRYAAWSHRFGVAGYAAFLIVFVGVEVSSYGNLNSDAAQRASFGVQMQKVGDATSYLVAPPLHLELLDGYLQWFLVGFFPVFLPVWALIAGTGAFRGEEESGLLEQWLATGITRGRLVAARLLGFLLALAATVLAIDLVLLAAVAAGGARLNTAGLLQQSVAEAAVAPPIFMLGAFLAQFYPTRRNALGSGALVVGLLFFFNSATRSVGSLQPYRWISPWAYADLSHAMTPGGELSIGGVVVLVALTLVLAAGVWQLLGHRDVGSGLIGGERAGPADVAPTSNPIASWPGLSAVWEQRVGLGMWMLGIAGYCFINVPVADRFVDFFRSQIESGASPAAAQQAKLAFGFGGADPVAGFVSAVWFHVVCIMLSAYAITQVARWSAEDAEGRLEVVLAAGRPRWRVATDRVVGLTVALSVLIAGEFGVLLPALRLGHINVATERVLLASIMVLPVALAFGAAGAAIASFRPRVAVWSMSALVAIGYLIPLMAAQIFRQPPEWFLDLSPFQLYGAPLVDGVYWKGLWILLGIAVTGFGLSAWMLNRREVGR